jgi:hypothetical protein
MQFSRSRAIYFTSDWPFWTSVPNFIRGQTTLFIHKTHFAKYRCLLVYHPPSRMGNLNPIERRMHGSHWHVSFYLFRTVSSKTQITFTLAPGVSFWMHLKFCQSNTPDRSWPRCNESDRWLNDTPCRAMVWTINSGANLLSFYWIPNRRLKGSMRDYSRMRRNCFDRVLDISEQSKTAYWIENSASFNIMCIKSNISARIAAKSRPEIIHWILNIILYCEFMCSIVDNWRTENAF